MDSFIFFSSERDGDVLIISLLRNVGSFAEDDARDEWSVLMRSIEETNTRHVVLDFRMLNYFGSTLLEWMVTLWKKLRRSGGTMRICGLSEVGAEILRTAKFDTLWPVHATREEAIAAIRS